MRSEEMQINDNARLRGHGLERGMHYQARRKQSLNVGEYGLQAAHRQRFKRNAVPGQRGIGWSGPAAAEFAGVAVRLSGLELHTLARRRSARGPERPWLRRYRPCSSMTLMAVPPREPSVLAWTARTTRST